MGNNLLTNSPFAVLSFMAAPALLTNATNVLAMSTINRMLRTRERMHDLLKESESGRGKRLKAEVLETKYVTRMLHFSL